MNAGVLVGQMMYGSFSRWLASSLEARLQKRPPAEGSTSDEPGLDDRHFRVWGSAATDSGKRIADQTIRTIVSPRGEGTHIRLRFSNLFGKSDLVIASVKVATHAGGARIVPVSEQCAQFNGARGISIPPGQTRLSDSIAFSVRPFEKIAVSCHVSGTSTQSTRHFVGNEINYLSKTGKGEKTSSDVPADFLVQTQEIYFLTAIEAVGERPTDVIVAVGDSITDGYVGTPLGVLFQDKRTVGKDQRYPDFLAQRLHERFSDGKQYVVINAGVSGNRLLSHAMVGFPRFGPSLLSRLERDVINVPGVRSVIVLVGTNDVGLFPRSNGQAVIGGLQRLVDRLKIAGLKVYLGTQTPSQGLTVVSAHGLSTAVEFRNQINEWVRTQSVADGVVDFFNALNDPNKPDSLAPAFDCGDRLHPSVEGFRAMAHAVDLDMITQGLRA